MYEFTPQKSNKNDQLALIALIATALVTMFLSSLDQIPYRSLLQLLTLMMLTLSLALLGRYRFRTYVYTLVPTDAGGYDLCVTEIKKRSRITVCRISLSSIERVFIGTPELLRSVKDQKKGCKLFNYCVDLAPKRRICIFANESGEPIYIELSWCEKLTELLEPKNNGASEL